jgi:hypothetical protein
MLHIVACTSNRKIAMTSSERKQKQHTIQWWHKSRCVFLWQRYCLSIFLQKPQHKGTKIAVTIASTWVVVVMTWGKWFWSSVSMEEKNLHEFLLHNEHEFFWTRVAKWQIIVAYYEHLRNFTSRKTHSIYK